MAGVHANGIEQINKSSFGCSCNALGTIVQTLSTFPYDLPTEYCTADQKERFETALAKLREDCKKWTQGKNYNPGSAVFCLLTKNQLDAKRVLEECGFEELGRTVSSHIWPCDMEDFARKLDASEVIYLMGKGWYHKPKEIPHED